MRRSTRALAVFVAMAASLMAALPVAGFAAPPREADEWVPSQIQPTKYPLRWSRATLDDKVTLDSLGRRPVVDPLFVTALLACERERQLDCVESLGLVSKSGEYSPGRWVQGITFDIENVPDGVAPYSAHRTIWEIPGLIVNGRPAKLQFDGNLGGWDGTPGLNMDLNLVDVDLVPSTPDSPRGCRSMDQGLCMSPPDFPEDARIRVVLRTSWLAPAGIGARGKDVTLDSEDLGGGAHRWTLTGSPMLVQSRGGREEVARGYPTWVVSSFYFTMNDPRLGDPNSECAVNRPVLFSGNAQGLGMPRWNAQRGRLDLSMEAPHYWADRKTAWLGYYETSIPAETARCLWGIDPRMTDYLSVGVYSEDGEEKAATTSIAFRDNQVQIRAYDFTFSSNVIRAVVNVKAGQRCFTSGVKIKDLTCTKKGKRLVWVKRR